MRMYLLRSSTAHCRVIFKVIIGYISLLSLTLSLVLGLSLSGSTSDLYAQTQLTAGNNQVFILNDFQNGALIEPSVLNQWPQLCIKLNCTGEECSCTSDDFYNAQNQAS